MTDSTNTLVQDLTTNPEADLRRRSAEELIAIGGNPDEVIAAFARGLSDMDKGVRDICATGLASSFKEFASRKAQAIAPLITHNDIEVRNLAGDVLIKLGAPSAEILYAYLLDAKADNRKFACDIIGLVAPSLPAEKAAKAGDLVGALLRDKDVNVRCAAVEALGYMKVAKFLPDLQAAYRREEDMRPYTITAMGNIGGRDATTFLLGLMDESADEPFYQMMVIDALSVCAEDMSIAEQFMERLSYADLEVQLLLLKAIYAIAFRLNRPLALADEYRDVARHAMAENDTETRIAGLLALGPVFYEADIPALLNEVKENSQDTQRHILYTLLSRSAPATVGAFFDKVFDAVSENCVEVVELFGQLVSMWANATPENSAVMLDTITRQYPNISSDYQKEVVELLLSVNRERLVSLLQSELTSGNARRIEDALQHIDLYSIRELAASRDAALQKI
jgi:hypothetical protein